MDQTIPTVEFLLLLLIPYMLYLLKKLSSSYLSEKGKNLATKEDVELITLKIESVKTKISEVSHISKYRYDKEYSILVNITEKVFILRSAFEALTLNYEKAIYQSEEMEKYRKANYDLYVYCNSMRPFYANDIYEAVVALDNLCWAGSGNHAILVKALENNFNNALEVAMKKLNDTKREINESMDIVNRSVRHRIENWEI